MEEEYRRKVFALSTTTLVSTWRGSQLMVSAHLGETFWTIHLTASSPVTIDLRESSSCSRYWSENSWPQTTRLAMCSFVSTLLLRWQRWLPSWRVITWSVLRLLICGTVHSFLDNLFFNLMLSNLSPRFPSGQ